jgi:hypothetical protein
MKIGSGCPLTPVAPGRWRPYVCRALGAVALGASLLLRARGFDSTVPRGSRGEPPVVFREREEEPVLQETEDREEIIERVARWTSARQS